MLLLICELFKPITVIKKQFSLATLTLRYYKISSLTSFLGLITFLSIMAMEVIGKGEYGTWENRSVWCWGPAHLASLHIAARVFLSSQADNFSYKLLACWPVCMVPGKFQNVTVNEDLLPVDLFQLSSHSISPQPWAQVSLPLCLVSSCSQAFHSSPEPSPLLLPLRFFSCICSSQPVLARAKVWRQSLSESHWGSTTRPCGITFFCR